MSEHRIPAVDERFDLEGWFRVNVRPGDTVHLAAGHRYWTERFSVAGLDRVTLQGHGATLQTREPPPAPTDPDWDWRRTFELVNCDGWRIFDLTAEGNRPAGAGFDPDRAGQHGFAFLGCRDTVAWRVNARFTWGDAFYLGPRDRPTQGILLFDPTAWEVGRNGISSVAAEDVIVHQPWMALIGRTPFNFEVHPGEVTRRWEATSAVLGHYGLNAITATGEGDASEIAFRGLAIPPSKRFNAIVCGTGAEVLTGDQRPYGRRRDWTIENVTGGMDPAGRAHYLQFLFVDGLRLRNAPYPMTTTGSRQT